jgi:hypothetical protein
MQPVQRTRARGLNYRTWYEQIGRPNKLPARARGGGSRARRHGAPRGRILRYHGSLYAVGDDGTVTILCGDRSTPASSDVLFNPSVEMWRDLVSSFAGDIPVNFLLAWIQIESCGSPCSFTASSEAGIFQLMPGDNINVAQTSVAALHPQPPCGAGNSFVYMSALTDDQQVEQVASGLRYVNYCRDTAHKKLQAAGQDWSEDTPDFWMMVKQVHAAPAYISTGLANATSILGYPPTDWAQFKLGLPGYNLSNAEWTGSFGIGGGGVTSSLMTVLALLGIGYLAYRLSS